jgi:hypothetical protein
MLTVYPLAFPNLHASILLAIAEMMNALSSMYFSKIFDCSPFYQMNFHVKDIIIFRKVLFL